MLARLCTVQNRACIVAVASIFICAALFACFTESVAKSLEERLLIRISGNWIAGLPSQFLLYAVVTTGVWFGASEKQTITVRADVYNAALRCDNSLIIPRRRWRFLLHVLQHVGGKKGDIMPLLIYTYA